MEGEDEIEGDFGEQERTVEVDFGEAAETWTERRSWSGGRAY